MPERVNEKIRDCPDCMGGTILVGDLDENGYRKFQRRIWCTNEGCDFEGVEQLEVEVEYTEIL